MNEISYTLTKVETHPQLDPWHANTGGSTYTELLIAPEYSEVMLHQEDDDNATPAREWHNLDIAVHIHCWPDEDQARSILEDSELVRRVIAGWSSDWDGSNMVGNLTDDANAALTELVEELENCSDCGWSLQAVDDWLGDVNDFDLGITPETTYQDLPALAAKIDEEAAGDQVTLYGDTEDYLRDRLDELLDN